MYKISRVSIDGIFVLNELYHGEQTVSVNLDLIIITV